MQLPSGVTIVKLYPALQSDWMLMDSLRIEVPSPLKVASSKIELAVVIEVEKAEANSVERLHETKMLTTIRPIPAKNILVFFCIC